MRNNIILPIQNSEETLAFIKYSQNVPSKSWRIFHQEYSLRPRRDHATVGINDLIPVVLNRRLYGNICFLDNHHIDNSIRFVIELREKCVFSKERVRITRSFTFQKTPTGEVDLTFSEHSMNGDSHQIVYRNCCYFGISSEKVSTDPVRSSILMETTTYIVPQLSDALISKFVVSNLWQDKVLPTTVNLLYPPYEDFKYIVYYINEFIQKDKPCVDSVAIPLLKIVSSHKSYTEPPADASYFVEVESKAADEEDARTAISHSWTGK